MKPEPADALSKLYKKRNHH